MSYKWDGDKVEAMFRKKVITYLHACGNVVQNQMVMFCHVDTGLLINSVNYVLYNNESGKFGSSPGTKGKMKIPDESDKVSKPEKLNSVRVGSGLVYAGPQEKHNNWASKGFDEVTANAGFEKLAAKIFKGFFG